MKIDWQEANIYVRAGWTDMRRQINGLAAIVEEELGGKPFSGDVFLFCNKRRTHLKALYWDRNGFWLALKRLEADRFPWPEESAEARKISAEQLCMLLDGIDFWHAHRSLQYTHIR